MGVDAAFHYFSITVTHLRSSLTRATVKLKAPTARSVNNYRQPDGQRCNWTYTELRYDDRQIPIKLIHFIGVFLGVGYVWAGLNPLTEASDTYAKNLRIGRARLMVRAT